MEKSKYPKLIKLKNGKYTFRNADGSRWEKEYNYALPFNEGLASVSVEPVEYSKKTFTFVDEHGNEWENRFFQTYSFENGIAQVKLEDDLWGFVDHDQNVRKETFKYPPLYIPSLITAVDGRTNKVVYFDKEQHFYTESQVNILGEICAGKPEIVLELKNRYFKDKGFIKLMCEAIKQRFTFLIDTSRISALDDEFLDDKFVNDTEKLLDDIKEKVAKERAVIEEKEKRKEKLLESINDFSL